MTTSNVLFLLLVAVASGFFALNVERLVRYLRIGRAVDRSDHAARRLANVLVVALGQSKLMREPAAGVMHALIFWGFIVLTAGTIELIAQGVYPPFSYGFLPDVGVPRVLGLAGRLRRARARRRRVRACSAGS